MNADREAAWIREQREIASQVDILLTDEVWQHAAKPYRLVSTASAAIDSSNTLYGGVDISFPENDTDMAVAVYTIVDADSADADGGMNVVYTDSEYFALTVPYVSSFLAFREIDPLVRLIDKQRKLRPEVTPRTILCDGNGVWHERRAGIATCLGVKTGIPTIGVAKSIYCCGGWTPRAVETVVSSALCEAVLFAQSEQLPKQSKRGVDILCANRIVRPEHCTDTDVNANSNRSDDKSLVAELSRYCIGLGVPLEASVEVGNIQMCALVGHGGRFKPFKASKKAIFISPGHRVSLEEAVSITAFLSLARIPEPVRQADLLGRSLLREKAAR